MGNALWSVVRVAPLTQSITQAGWCHLLRSSLFQIQGVQKVSVHLTITVFEQSPHNWWFEDGHHRIHSECGLCYTEHGLGEHSSVCQWMSGDWRGILWTLLVTFCIVIIRGTKIFYHSVFKMQPFSKYFTRTQVMSWSLLFRVFFV